MAIPVGTTSRQLGAIARWTLVWVVVLGSLSWWWVGYDSWAGLSGGILGVLGLWLMWRTVADNRTVPGHPLHIALVVPAVILACHFARHGLVARPRGSLALSGALDISMIFHLAVFAAGVMLTQSLFPRAARYAAVLAMCGAAMMGSSSAALAWGQGGQVTDALTLLGFAGVCVWLSLLWGLAPGGQAGGVPQVLRRRELRLGCIGLGGMAAALFVRVSPVAAVWAGIVVGGVLVVGALVFGRRRLVLLTIGAVLCGGGLCLVCFRGYGTMTFAPAGAGWFGGGETAFSRLSARNGGFELLFATTGWVGGLWCLTGACLCAVGLLSRARRRGADQGRAIVWLAATALASGAMMVPGGAFVPAATLAAAFTWGMLPAMLARPPVARNGVIMLVPTGMFMLALVVTRSGGLVLWMAQGYGYDDKVLHGIGGFVLAGVLAWLFGSRRWWVGLGVIALSALLGGAGELLQRFATTWRQADVNDWIAHALGSALAIVPYLLCVGSRMCESPEAVTDAVSATDPRSYAAPARADGESRKGPDDDE